MLGQPSRPWRVRLQESGTVGLVDGEEDAFRQSNNYVTACYVEFLDLGCFAGWHTQSDVGDAHSPAGSWPVNETVVMPLAFAASIARSTFTDRPDVENADEHVAGISERFDLPLQLY